MRSEAVFEQMSEKEEEKKKSTASKKTCVKKLYRIHILAYFSTCP